MMGDALGPADVPDEATELRVRWYDRDCAAWPVRAEVVVNGKVVGTYAFAKKGAADEAFPVAGELTATVPLAGAHGKRFYAYVRFFQGDATYTESSPVFFDLQQ